jgi:uncharacterized membrane protein
MEEFLLSIALLSCTGLYTYINWKIYVETKKRRELKTMPHIIAYLKSTEDHKTLRLYIENTGEGVAKNVKIDVLKDYNQFRLEQRKISCIGAMKYGLNIFPSKERYAYFVDVWTEIGKSKENLQIELDISYEGTDGKKYHNLYNLPLMQLSGQDYTNPPETYIGRIAYFLEKISGSLKKNQP